MWQKLASNSLHQHPTKHNSSKRRSSIHVASSLAQFARVSSGLGTFKRSTKKSIKVFNTLLSQVSEGETENFEPTNVGQITIMRQSTCSSITDSEYGIPTNESLRDLNESSNDIGKSRSPGSSSLFSRFFNWRKSSCEDNLVESHSPSDTVLYERIKRSASEEELLAFLERNPDFEGRIQLQAIPRSLKEVRNIKKPEYPSSSLGNMIYRQDSKDSFKQKLERCISSPTTEKAESKFGWQKKCSQSFSYGEGVCDQRDANIELKIATKPIRSDFLHVKLHRYKTFHGPSRKDNHLPKDIQKQNLLLQVPMMLLFVIHSF